MIKVFQLTEKLNSVTNPMDPLHSSNNYQHAANFISFVLPPSISAQVS